MKVLIVSDTHKSNGNFYKVLGEQKPDLVIHCGDAEGSEEEFEAAADCPVRIVLGNNDFFSRLPRELTLDVGPYKVWVVHGHNYYVSMGNERLKREASDRGFDIVMYGHTHRPVVDEEGDVIAVNPGSLSYPRQEGHRPSYVIMELDENDEVCFTIHFLK